MAPLDDITICRELPLPLSPGNGSSNTALGIGTQRASRSLQELCSEQREASGSLSQPRPSHSCIKLNNNNTTSVMISNREVSNDNNTIDTLEILTCITDAILIIGAFIVVVSVCVSFSIVGLKLFLAYSNHTSPVA